MGKRMRALPILVVIVALGVVGCTSTEARAPYDDMVRELDGALPPGYVPDPLPVREGDGDCSWGPSCEPNTARVSAYYQLPSALNAPKTHPYPGAVTCTDLRRLLEQTWTEVRMVRPAPWCTFDARAGRFYARAILRPNPASEAEAERLENEATAPDDVPLADASIAVTISLTQPRGATSP